MCFNSRTPGGVRLPRQKNRVSATCFNSRTPGGVRRKLVKLAKDKGLFQFTHPGRGATQNHRPRGVNPRVSIHAPREGCDDISEVITTAQTVSIHAPREGCDVSRLRAVKADRVSIHAPREGCDVDVVILIYGDTTFQFTHPGRGATPLPQ